LMEAGSIDTDMAIWKSFPVSFPVQISEADRRV